MILTFLAGTGTSGSVDGPATSSQMYAPNSIVPFGTGFLVLSRGTEQTSASSATSIRLLANGVLTTKFMKYFYLYAFTF